MILHKAEWGRRDVWLHFQLLSLPASPSISAWCFGTRCFSLVHLLYPLLLTETCLFIWNWGPILAIMQRLYFHIPLFWCLSSSPKCIKNPMTVVKGMALLPLANLSPGKCDPRGPSFCSVADELPGLWIAVTYDPPLLLRSLSSWIYAGIRCCVNLPWKPCAGKGEWFFRSVNICFIRLTYMGTLGLLFGPKRRSQAFIVNRWCC